MNKGKKKGNQEEKKLSHSTCEERKSRSTTRPFHCPVFDIQVDHFRLVIYAPSSLKCFMSHFTSYVESEKESLAEAISAKKKNPQQYARERASTEGAGDKRGVGVRAGDGGDGVGKEPAGSSALIQSFSGSYHIESLPPFLLRLLMLRGHGESGEGKNFLLPLERELLNCWKLSTYRKQEPSALDPSWLLPKGGEDEVLQSITHSRKGTMSTAPENALDFYVTSMIMVNFSQPVVPRELVMKKGALSGSSQQGVGCEVWATTSHCSLLVSKVEEGGAIEENLVLDYHLTLPTGLFMTEGRCLSMESFVDEDGDRFVVLVGEAGFLLVFDALQKVEAFRTFENPHFFGISPS